MQAIQNNIIKLRSLEPEDLDFLFKVENNPSFWEVSSTQTPFSKYILKKYLENSHQDIYEAKQLRLVIVNIKDDKTIGFIDLFDFNPQHKRAGIGILITKEFQNKGYANATLKLFIDYVFNHLNLHQIYANIVSDNKFSIQLFENLLFRKIGLKKEWILSDGRYKDVILYQLISDKS
jgi:diamine N-acetyltransferase